MICNQVSQSLKEKHLEEALPDVRVAPVGITVGSADEAQRCGSHFPVSHLLQMV